MKPIIVNPELTLAQMATDATNGVGRLDPISCYVDEERNGLYDLTMEISVDDPHFADVGYNTVLKVKAGHTAGLQLFRVNEITKPISGIVTVYAHHITYDLAKRPVLPFTATGALNTCSGLLAHIATATDFDISTDITNTTSRFTLSEPKYFRECLGGWQGSFLDVFGGEIEWDNLEVKIHAHRGSDKGYHVRYGKNLVDLRQEESIANVFTSAIGYVTIDDSTLCSDIQYMPNPGTLVRTKLIDFSDDYDAMPTKADLNTKVSSYIQSNPINVPHVNIELSFISLFDTEEYKDIAPLEYVDMGDTIHVDFERLGVSASAEVISTRWDVLRERLEKIEIGDAKTDLATSITEGIEQTTTEQIGYLDKYMTGLTQVITNSLGLFSTKVTGGDGSTKYYLHNRPTLAESQYQWTINAGGFAVSQDYGQTWTAGIDAQGNAVFNSLSANIVRAMEIYGSYINGSEMEFGSGDETATLQTETVTNTIYNPAGGEMTRQYLAPTISGAGFEARARRAISFKSKTSAGDEEGVALIEPAVIHFETIRSNPPTGHKVFAELHISGDEMTGRFYKTVIEGLWFRQLPNGARHPFNSIFAYATRSNLVTSGTCACMIIGDYCMLQLADLTFPNADHNNANTDIAFANIPRAKYDVTFVVNTYGASSSPYYGHRLKVRGDNVYFHYDAASTYTTWQFYGTVIYPIADEVSVEDNGTWSNIPV